MSESDRPSGGDGAERDRQAASPWRLDPDLAAGRPQALPDPDLGAEASPRRLDPDLAAAAARRRGRRQPPPVIDTRPYRRIIGLFGLALVVVIFISFLLTHGSASPGIAAGQRLHFFAAPLADTNLNGAANNNPPCTLARHDPRALNICLIARSAPLVLAFFVTGQSACVRQVDALQVASDDFRGSGVQFAALAVGGGHATTAAAVRSHRWTIPVAYDEDGRVGQLYGVVVCPIVEIARRGGVVAARLIGEHWTSAPALEAAIRKELPGS